MAAHGLDRTRREGGAPAFDKVLSDERRDACDERRGHRRPLLDAQRKRAFALHAPASSHVHAET
jgi:hypothetical protein